MTKDNWTSMPIYEEAAQIAKDDWDKLNGKSLIYLLSMDGFESPVNTAVKNIDEEIIKNLKQEGSNLVDSTGHLYFQCETCDALFDPDTTSFKTLHDKTKLAGWIIKWNSNGQGYKVYCVSCKECI